MRKLKLQKVSAALPFNRMLGRSAITSWRLFGAKALIDKHFAGELNWQVLVDLPGCFRK
jgi:hypothetical protein